MNIMKNAKNKIYKVALACGVPVTDDVAALEEYARYLEWNGYSEGDEAENYEVIELFDDEDEPLNQWAVVPCYGSEAEHAFHDWSVNDADVLVFNDEDEADDKLLQLRAEAEQAFLNGLEWHELSLNEQPYFSISHRNGSYPQSRISELSFSLLHSSNFELIFKGHGSSRTVKESVSIHAIEEAFSKMLDFFKLVDNDDGELLSSEALESLSLREARDVLNAFNLK